MSDKRRKSSGALLDQERQIKISGLASRLLKKTAHSPNELRNLKTQIHKKENEAKKEEDPPDNTAWAEGIAALTLSKVMNRRKGAEVSLQLEIENETQWKMLLRKEGLIVVEVYAAWCGPCLSMVNILKKVKVEANDDRLTLAVANSDNIEDLKIFRGQSEPAWIFIGGGKPVRVMRGADASKLVAIIRSEFQHELLCMEGKAKRNLISINEEAERIKKAKSDAMYLATAKTKQEEVTKEQTPVAASRSITATPKTLSQSGSPTREASVEVNQVNPEPREHEPVEETEAEQETESQKVLSPEKDEMLDSLNKRLASCLQRYAVLAIQRFLLETGAVTEIKDKLAKDFKLIKERYIHLDEEGVRRLYGIPYEIEELISQDAIKEETEASEMEDDDVQDSKTEKNTGGESQKQEVEGEEGEHDEEDLASEEAKVKPVYKRIPIPLPEDLVGDSLLFLLEAVDCKEQKRNADELLAEKVGILRFQDALQTEPKSLTALYGKEEYAVGVWCPQSFEDKKHVLLTFFPMLVAELLLPPTQPSKLYRLAIFPVLFSNEITEHEELNQYGDDIIAEGKTSLPAKLVNKILISRGTTEDEFVTQREVLTGSDVFVISIDERNEKLAEILMSLEPIHYSVDTEHGRFETAKLFPHLNILVDDDEEDNEDDIFYTRQSIVEKFLSRPKPEDG